MALRLDDGRSILFRTVGHRVEASGDTVALMDLVEWIGVQVPSEETIAALPALDASPDWPATWPERPFGRSFWVPQVIGPSVRDRLSVVGHFSPPPVPVKRSRRFGVLPKVEQGWGLAHRAYIRWDSVARYALFQMGEGPDPDA